MRHDKLAPSRLLAFTAASMLCASPSLAVIIGRELPAGVSTSAPTGLLAGSGWQYHAQPGGMIGTAIAPNYVISAKHVGGNVGQTIRLGGKTYPTIAKFEDPDSDLRIWKVAGTIDSYAPLHRSTDVAGKPLLIIGRGTDRGPAITSPAGTLLGYQWGADIGNQRWGTNTADAIVEDESLGEGPLLQATFDGGDDATVSSGDSGGGWFINDNGTWKLAAVAYGVENQLTLDEHTYTGALIGLPLYGTSIGGNLNWIDSIIGTSVPLSPVPEPAAASLALLAAATTLTRRRR